MIVYRLSKKSYAHDLMGKGAAMAGGRWNSKGVPILYTSSSRALCTAELAVHLPLGILPSDYVIIAIHIPDTLRVNKYPEAKLPENWNQYPYSIATQKIGNDFIKQGKTAILKIPSAVVEGDYNFLINPFHPAAIKIRIKEIKAFHFDARLFKR
jgi:RES domain-containing protein